MLRFLKVAALEGQIAEKIKRPIRVAAAERFLDQAAQYSGITGRLALIEPFFRLVIDPAAVQLQSGGRQGSEAQLASTASLQRVLSVQWHEVIARFSQDVVVFVYRFGPLLVGCQLIGGSQAARRAWHFASQDGPRQVLVCARAGGAMGRTTANPSRKGSKRQRSMQLISKGGDYWSIIAESDAGAECEDMSKVVQPFNA